MKCGSHALERTIVRVGARADAWGWDVSSGLW